jgi:hypothetical protein
MNRTMLTLVSVLGLLAAAPAFAGQDQYPEGSPQPVFAGRLAVVTGSEAEPVFTPGTGAVQSNVARNDTGSAGVPEFDGQRAGVPMPTATLALSGH